MPDPVLLIDKADGIATLTLNRPQAMNALSGALRSALGRTFRELASSPEARVIILTGSGRAFCAGLDLKELGGETETSGDGVSDTEMLAAISEFPGPVIGAINGHAITGGFELALACDLLIGSTGARFADTHARVGLLPGWGLSQKLPRLIGIHRAKEISFTGNFVSADQACAWGLLNRVVEPDELLPACRALASDMVSCVPEVLREYKQLIDRGFGTTFAEGMALESELSRAHAKTMTAERFAERRRGVQERGRSQDRNRDA